MSILLKDAEVRRFTAREYDRLGELGVISSEERVELIEGIICKMGPEGKRHVAAIELVLDLFAARLRGRHRVRTQHPLTVTEDSQPEPDIAIVEDADPRAYLDAHPATALLVVEVSDNSLEKDLTWKADLYARGEIPEYWVLNLVEDNLVVLREPTAEGYGEKRTLERGETVSPLSFPEIEVAVDELLP
jgi:Uma2 family endonuclease